MRCYLSILFLLSLAVATAQDESTPVYDNNIYNLSEHYVFGDTVYVRSTGSLRAAVIDTLYLGHDVVVLKKDTASSTVRGFNAPWVKVSYRKSGTDRTGFVWSGLLSFTPIRRSATKFIFGFDRRHKAVSGGIEGFQYTAVLKVVEDGKQVDKQSFKMWDDESLSYIGGRVLPAGGLENVKFIIDLTYGGEACGVPTYDYCFAWNGTKLVAMPLLTNVGDADVFYHSEDFILPNDKNGLPKTVIVEIETGESTEEPDGRGDVRYSITGEMKYFNWDGKTFTFIKSIPKKKRGS